MSQPVYPNEHTAAALQAFPLPNFMPRTRREVNPHDAINARQFEHWQTSGKHGTYNRPDTNKSAPFYDMLPNSTRVSDRSYRAQPRFDADSSKGVNNPFFDKYDAAFDSRNMTRELRASVYEDKNTGFVNESDKLLRRNFDNRWLDPTVAKQQAAAAEELRPKMDDIRMFYSPLQNHPKT